MQHTKYCVACSGALAKFQTAQRVCYLIATAFVVGALVARSSTLSIGLVAVAVVLSVLGRSMSGWIQSFYYKGYDHSRMP